MNQTAMPSAIITAGLPFYTNQISFPFFLATIIVIASAIVTYYVALVWALLKPICGYVLINYIIQGAVNAIMLILRVAHLEAYGRERCSEE